MNPLVGNDAASVLTFQAKPPAAPRAGGTAIVKVRTGNETLTIPIPVTVQSVVDRHVAATPAVELRPKESATEE